MAVAKKKALGIALCLHVPTTTPPEIERIELDINEKLGKIKENPLQQIAQIEMHLMMQMKEIQEERDYLERKFSKVDKECLASIGAIEDRDELEKLKNCLRDEIWKVVNTKKKLEAFCFQANKVDETTSVNFCEHFMLNKKEYQPTFF